MRPHSIVMFERLFLASLVVNALGFVISYGEIVDGLAREPGLAELGVGGGFAIAAFAISMAVYLLLWFLIAHKAMNAAKWVLVVLVAIGLLSLPSALAGPFGLTTALVLLISVLQVAAVAYLFRNDARTWLRRKKPADPATLD